MILPEKRTSVKIPRYEHSNSVDREATRLGQEMKRRLSG